MSRRCATTTRRLAVAQATLAVGLAAIAQALPALAANPIEVESPWARAALAGRTSAAYMTLRNPGTDPDRLLSASTPAARTVELHTMSMDQGVMRMRPVQGIEVTPGSRSVLAPGGLHLMLIGLTGDLAQGGFLPLTLRFEKAGDVVVRVPVTTAGASGPPSGH